MHPEGRKRVPIFTVIFKRRTDVGGVAVIEPPSVQ
jgi:hypothetical protein